MAKKHVRKRDEEISFWQSYSDMMAALLLVFVLIIVASIAKEKSSYERMTEESRRQQAKIEEQQTQLKEQQSQLKQQQRELDAIVGVRREIVAELKKEFEDSDLNLVIDPETGAISFDSSVLFDYDKYELKASGKTFLNAFFPKYFDVIFKEDIKKYIGEVIIEGHTDQKGGYLYNLNLSQQRAYSVAEYCLGEDNKLFSGEELDNLRAVVTANGRSYYGLVYTDGKVDAEKSRRVEVKFRLTEEEMIQEMTQLLEMD